jgi:hypothetical protein
MEGNFCSDQFTLNDIDSMSQKDVRRRSFIRYLPSVLLAHSKSNYFVLSNLFKLRECSYDLGKSKGN